MHVRRKVPYGEGRATSISMPLPGRHPVCIYDVSYREGRGAAEREGACIGWGVECGRRGEGFIGRTSSTVSPITYCTMACTVSISAAVTGAEAVRAIGELAIEPRMDGVDTLLASQK